jgi:hypothetical protein
MTFGIQSPRGRTILPVIVALSLFSSALQAQNRNATQAGRFHVDHPTLLNLGFEWAIEGDANRNAAVAVRFRAVGESQWREALPLVRIGGENVYRRRENLDYTVPDGFAGTIFNLQPGTEYECDFHMSDPDGVTGQAAQTVRVKTSPASFRPTTGPVWVIGPWFGNAARSPGTFSCFMPASTDPSASTTSIR